MQGQARDLLPPAPLSPFPAGAHTSLSRAELQEAIGHARPHHHRPHGGRLPGLVAEQQHALGQQLPGGPERLCRAGGRGAGEPRGGDSAGVPGTGGSVLGSLSSVCLPFPVCWAVGPCPLCQDGPRCSTELSVPCTGLQRCQQPLSTACARLGAVPRGDGQKEFLSGDAEGEQSCWSCRMI